MLNRKKKDEPEMIEVTSYSDEELKSIEGAQPEQELFSEAPWKGTVNVYICNTCTHCTMKKDDIILHVVSHFPEAERSAMLDKLLKENK